jgi:hypothetical protein
MKFDYTMPPPIIRNETHQFKPSTPDNGSILIDINSLAVNPINHDDELVPGTTLPVPILNDWDTCTSNAENDTPTSTMLMTTSTHTLLKRHKTTLTLNGWEAKPEWQSNINEYVSSVPTESPPPSLTHTREKLTND